MDRKIAVRAILDDLIQWASDPYTAETLCNEASGQLDRDYFNYGRVTRRAGYTLHVEMLKDGMGGFDGL